MAIIYEENKETGLLAGYPVVKSFFKDDEVLHYDKINKQWVAKAVVALGHTHDDRYYTKDEVNNLIQEVIYVPDSVTFVVEDGHVGDVTDVQSLNDGNTLRIDETNSSPGYDVIFDFINVESFSRIWLHFYYNGNHTPKFEIWNYDTLSWDTFANMGEEDDLTFIDLPSDDINYIDGSGNARVRAYHGQSGSAAHYLILDYVALARVGMGTVNDHGALTGLSDKDHPASAIIFTPTGSIEATDVQAAIVEVAAEAGGAPEGTAVKSTGEVGGTKFLREDGDGTSSWQAVPGGHTQNTDTGLGTLGTKNPPIDADKTIYRDSTASDGLVTSTWTQIKAFLKTYFDAIYQAAGSYLTSSNISDAAYAAGWDGVTTIAPSKNAVYDRLETLSTSISGRQSLPTEDIVNEAGTEVNETNRYIWVVQTGEDPLSYDITFTLSTYGGIVTVYVQNIVAGGTVTLNFDNALNGTDPNIALTSADNGSTFIFAFSPTLTYWYEIL